MLIICYPLPSNAHSVLPENKPMNETTSNPSAPTLPDHLSVDPRSPHQFRHVLFNHVHWNVTRPFIHYLNAFRPSSFSEFTLNF